jgi:hypothetical protein|tara:strand:- start:1069 stop:1299 length:231 start_codon:yes stop_codon:yes gene_type:complete
MKLYKWDKHSWECETAKEFFDHVLEDSIIRAWVKDRSVMFNRLFMKGNWEQFSEEELAQKLVKQKILKIEEVANVR